MSETSTTPTKVLHIITGAPGAGKLVHVHDDPELHRLPIYCCYHLNKRFWTQATREAVLLCYSPRFQMKEHWMEQARQEGFSPRLYVAKTPKGECWERMSHRPKNNRLFAEIEDWFRNYTPHSEEKTIIIPKYNEKAERGIYSG
jgi:hypothetical protein